MMAAKLATYRQWVAMVLCCGGLCTVGTTSAQAATPSAEQALKLTPIQRDVDYDRPSPAEAARCTIHAEKRQGANRLGRARRRRQDAPRICRHQRRQRRRSLELLQGWRRSLSRHRSEVQRQGDGTSLAEHRRRAVGRFARRWADRLLENDLCRGGFRRGGHGPARSRSGPFCPAAALAGRVEIAGDVRSQD